MYFFALEHAGILQLWVYVEYYMCNCVSLVSFSFQEV